MASKGRGGRRGNAAALRRYWGSGAGAAKIRWGTPGDWGRCNKQLSRYLGSRARGYCQLMHIRQTGAATGSRRNVGRRRA